MAIGKQSLNRVANGTAAEPAPVPTAPVPPAAKPEKRKTASAAPKCGRKIYAIGDELPEYLL